MNNAYIYDYLSEDCEYITIRRTPDTLLSAPDCSTPAAHNESRRYKAKWLHWAYFLDKETCLQQVSSNILIKLTLHSHYSDADFYIISL